MTLLIVIRLDERPQKMGGVANLAAKSQDQALLPRRRLYSLG